MYGLTDNELHELCTLLARYEEIDQAILYGSLLPYNFDLSILHQLKSPELLEHIQRRGIVIYTK